ncbi:Malonyl CoA-acyl carrier protein transacylase [Chlamydiales bacterium STE3]|nr:Malonyl CoA-acyl carrier protein transacylase [Chlamydiales bacterium STE3]
MDEKMVKFQRVAFIFPGQGSQYPGMAKDFFENYSEVRHLFEEADDILKRKISNIILNGPEDLLTQTRNSQVGIFLTSFALLKVLKHSFNHLKPFACAGLSLGEYTALTAAGVLPFQSALTLVEKRGQLMNDACEQTKGTMAVIMGLDGFQVEQMVQDANLPNDLWAANFNCPGQVVISGTMKGIAEGEKRAKELGAKRVLPLQVYGAFHSGLMQSAEEKLREELLKVQIEKSSIKVSMNVTGDFVEHQEEIRRALSMQVTHPVRWEQNIRSLTKENSDLFIEIGPGKTLSGLNKRNGVLAPTLNLEKMTDLDLLAKELNG